MPKPKTRKTLTKRIKITSKGKILKKQTRIGHLKSKWSADKKFRKNQRLIQTGMGQRKAMKRLLGVKSKGVK